MATGLFAFSKIFKKIFAGNLCAPDVGMDNVLIHLFVCWNHNGSGAIFSGINPVISLLSFKNKAGL